jgi:hypothetical protein
MESSMMTKYIVSAIALGMCLIGTGSVVVRGDDDGGDRFQLRLEGFQEHPSLSTPARGRLTLEIQDNDTITYHLRYSGFEGTVVTASHIHFGARHTNAGVSAFLCSGGDKPACPSPAGEVEGTIDAADVVGPVNQGIAPGEFAELVRAIRAGYTYANVHSTRLPGGEIRGQIGNRGPKD